MSDETLKCHAVEFWESWDLSTIPMALFYAEASRRGLRVQRIRPPRSGLPVGYLIKIPGNCSVCGNPAREGKTMCSSCAEKVNAYQKRRKAEKGSLICTHCLRPAQEGRKQCASCAERMRLYNRNSRARRALSRNQ